MLNVYKSARNIPAGVGFARGGVECIEHVLSPRRLLVTKAALDSIRSRVSA